MKPMMRLPGMGAHRGMREPGGLHPLPPGEGLKTFEQVSREAADRYDGFVQRVGRVRADEAMAVAKAKPAGQPGSTTLPELLVEVALKRWGANYRVQVDLGWAVPDFVVMQDGGVIVIRVQGDYWHGGTAKAKDQAQAQRLITSTIFGLPVRAVVDVWEREIYEGEAVVERALQGTG